MKKPYPKLKKSVTTFVGMRVTWVIAILFFAISVVNSQNSTNVPDSEKAKSNSGAVQSQKESNPVIPAASLQNMGVTKNKLGAHAPDVDDPDFVAKKAEWIKNYPEEYNALLNTSKTGTSANTSAPNSDQVAKQAAGNGINASKSSTDTQPASASNIKANEYTPGYKIAPHAPEFNDPDYKARKEAWMANYPEEYNALQQSVNTPNMVNKSNIASNPVKNKVAEHAPDLNDPDYATKKAEWIKNYPEEYESIGGTTTSTTESNQVKTQVTLPDQPVAKPHTKIAEHAPYLDDPDYQAKKALWMKNYPEEMNAVMQQSSNTNKNLQPAANTIVNRPATKVAEHAPYLNDPDYEAKKAEWIKNYPQEYNAVNNKPANSVKNSPAGQGTQTPATSVPVYDATRK
ncbi:MAG TPA: hypothetical protein PLT47_03875 [Bacteroidales bacterium]|nr:hypothetical protein [Bacteroidales bacterium]